MKNQWINIAAAITLLPGSLAGVASASVLFTEDFEGHTDGQPVAGTNGWVQNFNGGDGSLVQDAASGTLLTGLALDGSTADNQDFITRDVDGPTPGDTLYTLTGDIVAFAAGTNNSFIGFGNGTIDQVALAYVQSTGWRLFVRDVGSVNFGGAGFSTDAAAQFSLEFDLVAGTVTATVTGDDGTVSSAALAFDLGTQLPGVDTNLMISQDTRTSASGIDLDNLQITSIPEPGAMILLTLGGFMLLGDRRLRKE